MHARTRDILSSTFGHLSISSGERLYYKIYIYKNVLFISNLFVSYLCVWILSLTGIITKNRFHFFFNVNL